MEERDITIEKEREEENEKITRLLGHYKQGTGKEWDEFQNRTACVHTCKSNSVCG